MLNLVRSGQVWSGRVGSSQALSSLVKPIVGGVLRHQHPKYSRKGNVISYADTIAHAPDHFTNEEVAQLVLDKHDKADLLPLVQDAVANHRRNAVRRVEVASMAAFVNHSRSHRPPPPAMSSDDRHAALSRLLEQSFRIGDGRMTTWGAATVQEHMDRISMLAKKRDGIASTIKRHEMAVAAIQQAGVDCLNEVGDLEPVF